MLIKDIKKENRPIERMLREGPERLSNEELLAIIINTGSKKKSSLDISYDIINSVNNLSDLLNLSLKELQKFEGIKETKSCRIEASFELTRRLLYHKNSKHPIISVFDSGNICYPKIAHYKIEVLFVLFLDSKCNLIRYKIYDGDIYQVIIPQNEVIKDALLYNARGIILSHNHPSGDPRPSKSDYDSTNIFEQKLQMFDLLLFDHIIVGDNSFYSISEGKIYHYNENNT